MQIGYGIVLEGEIFNFMRDMELKLFQQYGFEKGMEQPPHITIKPPFEVEEIDSYMDYLEEFCSKIDSFDVELEGFNSFSNKVIYLDVMKNDMLHKLNQIIMSDLKLESDEMIFHATLGYGDLSEEKFKDAFEYLKVNFKPKFKFRVSKIGIFLNLPNDAGWIIVKECSL
ncbi:hypothetical protein COY05_01100 [Candidatus Peregrinibacteria bacterium CG_4_10_14_0_2_um_filter_38_24]|nr:MAG: hypothetical protein COY05_01100 [Candidatus Peregrinibacteria bacterium CG_4_10_14_0_2_um_filter_38_24]PJC39172.1 MAG: hypothetical protein CO044_01135 [Candidatus Peregrinibacteria bacterium CG_4_9_14_0_2_um_filter_38_9]